MLTQLFAACLFVNPFFADMIGNVEYSLPPSKQHWKLAAEKKTEKNVISTTRRYLPEDRASVAIAEESFTANTNNLESTDQEDGGAIKGRIQKMFPQTEVDVQVVAQDPDSILYTWSVIPNEGKVSFWGVSKHFHLHGGTVNLLYKTTNKETFEAEKQTWVDALKQSHLQK